MRLPTSWKVHVTSGAPEATKQSLLKKEIASPRSQWLRVMGLRTHPVPQGVLVRDISMSLLTDQLIAYTQEKRLSTQTLRRWQSWVEEDQAALLVVAKELQLNENQLRDFLDWLEEIVTRDGIMVRDILGRVDLRHPLQAKLSRNDKVRAVKEALRKLRYPRLSRLEDDLRAAVKALDLGSRVRVSFPAALEGDEITFEIKASSAQELGNSLVTMQQKLADGSLRRVFELMDEV
jgi:hypothetical protein